jgi:uracil-DNA glycosylase family 4
VSERLKEFHDLVRRARALVEQYADSGVDELGASADAAELAALIGTGDAARAARSKPEPRIPKQRSHERPAQPAQPIQRAEPPARARADEPKVPTDPQERRQRLKVLAEEVRSCTKCRLHEARTQTVFARGNPEAEIAFVGEGPGFDEDKQGFPFVGKAGQLLDRMIAAMGYERDDVYVMNAVKCIRYDSQVLLENGSWERIGRLVASRYAGRVISVDADGRLVPKRVIGWHASPLGQRRVYSLSYASSALRGGLRARTKLTEDHPILTRRGFVEARDLRADDEIAIGQGLSQIAHETIVGTLLGDATVANRSACIEFVHQRDQREYVHLKARALQELNPIVYDATSSAQNGRTYLTTRCRTRATRALRVLRKQWYPDGRKSVPENLALTARSIALWFLDDGYTKIKSDRSALSEIASHSFAPDERVRLLELLARDFDIHGYERSSSPGRLHFGADATRRLSELIAPYCPPTMRYKLHPLLEKDIPFDATLFDAGTPLTLYDRVLVEEIEHKGTDKTFYCIDVEETHNFVTSGGVVHNCRPPNNRKPEPDEIAACGPYMREQLALVDPKVIVALGATGVEALIGSSVGITRLRGTWKAYKGRPLMPTFHPAYLLRTPEKKREVWEDLKAVLKHLGKEPPPTVSPGARRKKRDER